MHCDHWPLSGLRVATPGLELRVPSQDELTELAGVAAGGICKPGTTPFFVRWPYLPPAARARAFLQGQWSDRARWSAADWSLDLAVFADGRPVGMQELAAADFAVLRQVSSFSWLGLACQGQGIGTQMRAAVLHLAFAGLGAREAVSGAFEDNAASLAVSARLGYQPDGIERAARDGQVLTTRRLRLSRSRWQQFAEVPVTVSGLAPCLPLFGLPAQSPELAADGS